MNLFELEYLLRDAWTCDTCFMKDKENWSEKDPSYGQSLVTSLAVNDLIGAEIVVCDSSIGNHYFNLIDGKIFDLTTKQFHGESILYGHEKPVSRDELLSDESLREKYLLYLNNIRNNLNVMTNDVDSIFNKNFDSRTIKR